jgi:hypothetical protein
LGQAWVMSTRIGDAGPHVRPASLHSGALFTQRVEAVFAALLTAVVQRSSIVIEQAHFLFLQVL